MAESVSVQLTEQVDSTLEALKTTHPVYADLCKRGRVKAAEAQFDAIEKLDVVRHSGVDKEGRNVFMFFPAHLPEGVDLEDITMYALWLMHDPVVRQSKPYTAVWVCNNELDSRLSFWWFRRTYKMLPKAYHDGMRCLCIVHPSIQVRILLYLLSFFVKHTFWEKIFFADRIEFLDEVHCSRVAPRLRKLGASISRDCTLRGW